MKNNDVKTPQQSQIFLTLSKNAALGWSTGILVLLALFFLLGTLVGRGMIRVDMGGDGLFLEIAGLTETEKNDALNDMDTHPGQAPDFVFFKELNKDVDNEKPQSTARSATKIKSVVKQKKDIIKPAITKKEPVKLAETPKPDVKPEAPSSHVFDPGKKDPAQFKYTIQAASLKESHDADKMVAKLTKMGYPAYWVKGLVRDKEVWFRVRIGAFKDKIDAEPTLGRLKKDNIDGFFVKR
ncbi:MAG: SPOR domain-containing protein [Proteobacteria bacterium]|nr:SPOR domain-containing protein [Pseudomonadota bacterium]